eukprot:525866_1
MNNNNNSNEGERSADESQKIVKKDLEKIKWRHMKQKRGYRNGIYPKWSRLRGKVYKSTKTTFTNAFVATFQRMSSSNNVVPPVQFTRSKSSSTVLPLRPPNGHDH